MLFSPRRSQDWSLHYSGSCLAHAPGPACGASSGPDGRCSDMANLSRAKDAAAAIAERGPPPRNRRRFHWKLQWSKTPPGACPVRQPSLAGVRQRRAS
jgi:hypothetical protein